MPRFVMKLYIKIHESYRNVVALCDFEIIGKRFEEGKTQLEIRENFYKGEEVSVKEAIKILKQQSINDATFNIVGDKAVKTAFKAGIISKGNIGKVQNVPFALVLW